MIEEAEFGDKRQFRDRELEEQNLTGLFEKKTELTEKQSAALNFAINAVLSFVTVVPAMVYALNTIKFTYELNDDVSIDGILSGMYTGTADGHGIMISYPISGIISYLYKCNPRRLLWFWPDFPNWYVGFISVISILGMVFVLFKLLKSLSCNRVLLCMIYAFTMGTLWLGCFFDFTFSTAAAFMACIALLLIAFDKKEDIWKPWNLLLFAFYMIMAWSLRKPCSYMVLPFIILLLVAKYRGEFIKSWKPWCVIAVIGILMLGLPKYNGMYYSSDEWKDYYKYTRERSYIQDYASVPKYKKNKKFYDSLGISETELSTLRSYSYCIVDDFEPNWFHEIYEYVKSKEEPESYYKMARRMVSLRRSVLSHIIEAEEVSGRPLKAGIGLGIIIFILFILKIIMPREKEKRKTELAVDVLLIIGFAGLIYAEWAYLLYKGRFPRRVEETIWLLSISALVSLAFYFLTHFAEKKYFKIPIWIQIPVLAAFLIINPLRFTHADIQSRQAERTSRQSAESMVTEFCNENPDNIYVFDTSSFYDSMTPYENMSQVNMINTGGWRSYSPLYYEKLRHYGTDSLGSDFLLRDNVYLIMKENKGVAAKMGLEKDQVESEIVDVMQKDGETYKVVKVLSVNKEN